ncbi:hypothetical protein KAS06_02950 [Candidatus Bathyarchaeota archaeon]|nr:hypothetical protein [Candidatus Bathyarchaeota archaeon]
MTKSREVAVAVPASLVSDVPHLREKTAKIGIVGRAACIFGVEEIIVYADQQFKRQRRDANLIATILSYLETPQYLRKRLFKIRPELRYAGVLPPLRSRHHPLANRVSGLVDGEIREGAVVSVGRSGVLVDVGVDRDAFIRDANLRVGSRVTVALKKSKNSLEARVLKSSEIREYWGYHVTLSKLTLGKLLNDSSIDLVIGTSKYGKPFSEVQHELRDRMRDSQKVLVAFGAPSQGLYQIARREKIDLDSVADFVINVFPFQEVETVRTEEAILVALGILRFLTKS